MHRIRIWDLPTRLFHWALVVCVVGLVITGNVGGNAMAWHFRIGYAVLCLLLFRLAWGFVGGYWSRFARFLYGPATLLRYLQGRGTPEHDVGHSPVGALSVFALLGITAVQVGTGLFSDDEIAFAGPLTRFADAAVVGTLTGYHKEVGKLLLIALVVLHILAVVFYRVVKQRSLVPPMVHGDKVLPAQVRPSHDGATQRIKALVLLALAAAITTAIVRLGV